MSLRRAETIPAINALLIAGGEHHDFDFVRHELLDRIADNPAVRVTVGGDYSHIDALSTADVLVSYTCNVRPNEVETAALRQFVSGGGRWLALHATNAIADVDADGVAVATTDCSEFFELLGTRFITHPTIRDFEVRAPDDVAHPLLGDCRRFRTTDEIYLVERTADIDVLLETTYVGPTTGVPAVWDDDRPQPVLYTRRLGRGSIVYLALGHVSCASTVPGEIAAIERCSWEVPEFLQILGRAFDWAWSGA